MKRLLLVLSIITFLFSLPHNVEAQGNQIVTNGGTVSAVNFPGSGCTYNWVNDTPGIGLAASGTGDIASFKVVNNGNSPVVATITATPLASGFAYITNSAANTVSVINIATNTVVSNIQVGDDPQNVSVSPDGKKVYVTNPISNTISVISTTTNTVIATVPVGIGAFGMVASPDGSKIYLVNINIAQSADNISVINTATNAVESTISLGSKVGEITISPDGNQLYVANYGLNTVSVISTATNAMVATIPVGTYPYGVTASPDGSRVYVANEIDNTVSVINTATNAVIATTQVGDSPIGVAVSPDGSRLYVTNFFVNGTVSVINTTTNGIIATIPVGQAPAGVSVSPDGRFVYVANSNSGNVSVINTLTNNVISTIPVGANPFSYGNFISIGAGCPGTPIKFTITVNPAPSISPTITTTSATGTISACAGTTSASPQIQQFTVSGNNLTGNITATAPTGFEISLAAGGSYGNSVSIPQTAGSAGNTVVYVRSAASAAISSISGNVTLTSAGASSQTIAVSGTVNALPTVNAVANQIVNNGAAITAVNFAGTGNTFTWINDTPGIGLAASGTGTIASFTAVNTGSTPVKATVTVTPLSIGYAYITNNGDGTVSVINTLTNLVVATIPVGLQPYGITVSPLGNFVYAVNEAGSSVSVINIADNTVVNTIPVNGLNPRGICISPDGSRLYVANEVSANVSVINTTTGAVISTINVGISPLGICVSPDGSRVYVTNQGSNSVSVINTANNTVVYTIPVGPNPNEVAVTHNGNEVFITSRNPDMVYVVDATNNSVISTIPVGMGPVSLAISTDDNDLYVLNLDGGSVSVIDIKKQVLISTIPLAGASSPFGISITPDDSQIYVTSQNGIVYVINTATNLITGTIKVGSGPLSFGNFITPGTGCPGTPIKFTITINPTPVLPPAISVNIPTGAIFACAGTASASPQIQQCTVSGYGLTDDITATAPNNFEISFSENTGYSNTLILTQSGGTVNNSIIYVRSAASAPVGNISGSVVLTSPGASTLNPPVTGTVNALPAVNTVVNQSVNNGAATAAVNFTGTGNTFNWVNDTPGIGLAASGTGDIASFVAINTGGTAVKAAITVTPGSTGADCTGTPVTFTITVNPTGALTATITASGNPAPLNTIYGTASTATIFTVSGTNMSAGILVTPPAGFELSTNDITYSKTLTIGAAGTVASTTVYIRLASSTPVGNYSGNIILSSKGASDVDVVMPLSTVTPAQLTITADNKSKTFGQANPVLTLTYDSFVNNDGPAQLIAQPLVATPAVTNSPVGQYPITVSGAAALNYTITQISGILTINPVPQNIIIPNTFTPNGDGVNDTWDIKYLNSYLNCTVEIFNRYGQNVYSSNGYGIPWDGTYKGAALPTGTYYYIINLKNNSKVLSGFVAIIR